MFYSSSDRGSFMKKFCFDTNSNITQEPNAALQSIVHAVTFPPLFTTVYMIHYIKFQILK